jgi:uncharacterized protein (DUF885 family)
MTRWASLLSLLFILQVLAFAAEGNSQSSARLARITDEYWQHQLRTVTYYKLQRGEQIDDLPDISERGVKAEGAFARHLLRELAAVKPGDLDHQDWLTLEIMRWRVRQDVGWSKYYWLKFVISPSSSEIVTMERIFTEHPFRNQADLDHYLALLKKVPAFFNQTHSILKAQVRRGIVYPKDGLPVVIRIHLLLSSGAGKERVFRRREAPPGARSAAHTIISRKGCTNHPH